MSTVIITETILQQVSPSDAAFQKKLAPSLLLGGPHQNLRSTSAESVDGFASATCIQSAIPTFPSKVKVDHIEKSSVVQKK